MYPFIIYKPALPAPKPCCASSRRSNAPPPSPFQTSLYGGPLWPWKLWPWQLPPGCGHLGVTTIWSCFCVADVAVCWAFSTAFSAACSFSWDPCCAAAGWRVFAHGYECTLGAWQLPRTRFSTNYCLGRLGAGPGPVLASFARPVSMEQHHFKH